MRKRETLTTLEAEMADAAFWNNQERAREVVQRTKALRGWIEPFDKLWNRVQAALEMDALLDGDPDPEMIAEVAREAGADPRGDGRVRAAVAAAGSRRLSRRAGRDRGRRRRHRGAGLGPDADAHVHALGGAEAASPWRSST